MPFLVQIEQLHSPTVDCSRSTRMRNRTRPQWQPPSYVCSISLLLCRSTLFRLSFWGSSAHNPPGALLHQRGSRVFGPRLRDHAEAAHKCHTSETWAHPAYERTAPLERRATCLD